jgi:hypothetical protein
MYVNTKMLPVETISGIREGGGGTEVERGELKYDIFDML